MLPRKFICVNFFHFGGIVKNLGKIYLLKTQSPKNVLKPVLLHTQRNAKFSNKLSTAHDITFHMYACYNCLNRYKLHIYNSFYFRKLFRSPSTI